MLMYGRGANAIAEQLGWTKEQAQKVVDMFFDRFPAVKQVVEHFQNMARTKGYVETVYGRKRRLPEINLPEFSFEYIGDDGKPTGPVEDSVAQYYEAKFSKVWGNKQKNALKKELKDQGVLVHDNGGKIADAERQTLNSVVQGSGADITKKAMVDLGSNKRLRELDALMVLPVHDEVIMTAPEENALEVAELMSEIMIQSCINEVCVKMSCDAEITRIWTGDDITKELESAV